MQGVFIQGQRPKSKKAIKEALANSPNSVTWEATSLFGNEFGGYASDMPEGRPIHFVGPDPYRKRNFYGSAVRHGDKFTVK
jgi:hypothetical protein